MMSGESMSQQSVERQIQTVKRSLVEFNDALNTLKKQYNLLRYATQNNKGGKSSRQLKEIEQDIARINATILSENSCIELPNNEAEEQLDEVRSQMSALTTGNENPECFFVGGSTTPPIKQLGKARVQSTAAETHLDAAGTPASGDVDKPRGRMHVDTPHNAMLPSKIVTGEAPKPRGRMRAPSDHQASADHLSSTDGAMVSSEDQQFSRRKKAPVTGAQIDHLDDRSAVPEPARTKTNNYTESHAFDFLNPEAQSQPAGGKKVAPTMVDHITSGTGERPYTPSKRTNAKFENTNDNIFGGSRVAEETRWSGTGAGHRINESINDEQYQTALKQREREVSESNLANIKKRVPSRRPIVPQQQEEEEELPPPPPKPKEYDVIAQTGEAPHEKPAGKRHIQSPARTSEEAEDASYRPMRKVFPQNRSEEPEARPQTAPARDHTNHQLYRKQQFW